MLRPDPAGSGPLRDTWTRHQGRAACPARDHPLWAACGLPVTSPEGARRQNHAASPVTVTHSNFEQQQHSNFWPLSNTLHSLPV